MLLFIFLETFAQNCYFHSNQNLDTYGEIVKKKRSIDIPNE